jgi:hypothetical protein
MSIFQGIRKPNSIFSGTCIQETYNKMFLLGTDLESILDNFFLDYYLPSLKNPRKALLTSAAKFSALDCAVSRVVNIFILKILHDFRFLPAQVFI